MHEQIVLWSRKCRYTTDTTLWLATHFHSVFSRVLLFNLPSSKNFSSYLPTDSVSRITRPVFFLLYGTKRKISDLAMRDYIIIFQYVCEVPLTRGDTPLDLLGLNCNCCQSVSHKTASQKAIKVAVSQVLELILLNDIYRN